MVNTLHQLVPSRPQYSPYRPEEYAEEPEIAGLTEVSSPTLSLIQEEA